MHRHPMRFSLLVLMAAALGASPAQPAAASAPAQPRRAADDSLRRALQDHDWTLNAAVDATGKSIDAMLVPGHPFVLRFESARVAVQGGCNLMTAQWRLSPQNSLTVGRAAATQKACEPPLMAADAAMAAALSAPLQARLDAGDAPTLHLVSAERQTLSFSGRRTFKSLYGAPTRIFMEVAAQRVACTPALQPPGTCLQVREVRFDDKGLRVGQPGAWQAFYGEIAGYAHQPGVSNVLRINRYKRPQPPADGSAYVYQLDLVVESRVEEKK